MALPEMVDKIISFLDKNNQMKCLRVNTTWYDLTLRSRGKECQVSANVALIACSVGPSHKKPSRATWDMSGKLYIEHPGILLPLLANAPSCTNLVPLQCSSIEYTTEQFRMLQRLIRNGPSLSNVDIYGIPQLS
jgi:hypothetical protein